MIPLPHLYPTFHPFASPVISVSKIYIDSLCFCRIFTTSHYPNPSYHDSLLIGALIPCPHPDLPLPYYILHVVVRVTELRIESCDCSPSTHQEFPITFRIKSSSFPQPSRPWVICPSLLFPALSWATFYLTLLYPQRYFFPFHSQNPCTCFCPTLWHG